MLREKDENLVKESLKVSKLCCSGRWSRSSEYVQESGSNDLTSEGLHMIGSFMYNNLKRFKDDVKEVVSGLECGVMVKDYQDIKENDIIEVFEEIEVQRKL